MIYLFTGDDTTKKLAAYEKFVASFPASVETFVINKNEFDPVQLWSLYSGSGLFFALSFVIFLNLKTRGILFWANLHLCKVLRIRLSF